MIEVDISNVWNRVSLPELLGLEGDIFAAHQRMTEGGYPDWLEEKEVQHIQDVAEKIREESDVCVVAGTELACRGSRGVIELLQGSQRNLGKGKGDPVILFAGDSFSTLQWNRLCRSLEGKDISLIVLSETGDERETMVAFRGLRWILERKYGTEEAAYRIYGVTKENGLFHKMATAEGWELFLLPETVDSCSGLLRAGGLLPMAVAGVDISAILRGGAQGKNVYDLRSFENPVWLYVAARRALADRGCGVEQMVCGEPDLLRLGNWWQGLFDRGRDPFPVFGCDDCGRKALVETWLCFAAPEPGYTVQGDARDQDGLNELEGKTLEELENMAFQAAVESRGDRDIPVIILECSALNAETVGQLIWFFLLAGGISRENGTEL